MAYLSELGFDLFGSIGGTLSSLLPTLSSVATTANAVAQAKQAIQAIGSTPKSQPIQIVQVPTPVKETFAPTTTTATITVPTSIPQPWYMDSRVLIGGAGLLIVLLLTSRR